MPLTTWSRELIIPSVGRSFRSANAQHQASGQGVFPYRARSLGELPSNSSDRTVEASPPIRATSPTRKPVLSFSPPLLQQRYPRRCPKESAPNRSELGARDS